MFCGYTAQLVLASVVQKYAYSNVVAHASILFGYYAVRTQCTGYDVVRVTRES